MKIALFLTGLLTILSACSDDKGTVSPQPAAPTADTGAIYALDVSGQALEPVRSDVDPDPSRYQMEDTEKAQAEDKDYQVGDSHAPRRNVFQGPPSLPVDRQAYPFPENVAETGNR